VIGYSPEREARDALYALGEDGFTCYEPQGGIRCEKTWTDPNLPVEDGRTLFWRDGVIVDTQYSNLAPTGYTDAVIAALWPVGGRTPKPTPSSTPRPNGELSPRPGRRCGGRTRQDATPARSSTATDRRRPRSSRRGRRRCVHRVRSPSASHANPAPGSAAAAMAPASVGTVASVVETAPASACHAHVKSTWGWSA
jgi:hypothetical protein